MGVKSTMSMAAFIAINRFGLGAKAGEIGRVASDPKGWLRDQLIDTAVPGPLAGLPSGADGVTQLLKLRQARKEAKEGGAAVVKDGGPRQAYIAEARARSLAMIRSDQPFLERLVAFWGNHFTVSILRPEIAGLAGAFEREAIRPHVLGRFADMLRATTRHPAMLFYLDNVQSIGPNSKVGQRNDRGLNENLAREILELHTLGVDGGYSQSDVTEFARLLTGWSVARLEEPGTGGFRFRDRAHEPGVKTVLGARYHVGGEEEGDDALAALAAHPATARHVATKLARHFISDQPPPAAVDRLAARFRDTGGDLKAVSLALIEEPEAWAAPLVKYKTPQELVISAFRALGDAVAGGDGQRALAALVALGQTPFHAPSPAGWPDTADQWLGSDALMKRIDWCSVVGERVAGHFRADALLADALEPVATPELRAAVTRAATPGVALALVLASPEFQRR